MRSLLLTLAATASLAGVSIAAGHANAAPLTQPIVAVYRTGDAPLLDQVQFLWVFGGRHYCWYYAGWDGPGYYWCGYAWRRGYGWGGGYGWNGWRGGGRGGGGRGGGHAMTASRGGGGRGGGHAMVAGGGGGRGGGGHAMVAGGGGGHGGGGHGGGGHGGGGHGGGGHGGGPDRHK